MAIHPNQPWGYRWRSSKIFISSTITVVLFAGMIPGPIVALIGLISNLDTFLYSFLVPILSHMLDTRLHIDPSQTQHFTNVLLSSHGLISLVSAPIIARFADRTPNRKVPLLICLAVSLTGTILVACTPLCIGTINLAIQAHANSS